MKRLLGLLLCLAIALIVPLFLRSRSAPQHEKAVAPEFVTEVASGVRASDSTLTREDPLTEFERPQREPTGSPPVAPVAPPKAPGSIRGRVVNENGEPIAGVSLLGFAKPGGGGSSGRSGSDGSFDIVLRQVVPHRFFLRHAEHESFEEEHFHEPGTQDLEFVLTVIPKVTFLVRDEVTGLAVERFGLRTFKARMGNHREVFSMDHAELPELQDHPEGRVIAIGLPESHDYTIIAPGYGPQRGAVAFDSPGSTTQTILLGPGGAIAGRFLVDEEVVAFPQIECAANIHPERFDSNPEWVFHPDWGRESKNFAGYRRSYFGDENGSFLIEDLAPGDYQMELRGQLESKGEETAPMQIVRVTVSAGGRTELGDLRGYIPGEIAGTLLLPKSLSAEGITVSLGTESRSLRRHKPDQVSDPEGGFRFEDLSAGVYYLWFEAKAGVIVKAPALRVELLPQEKKVLEIDLSDRVPCTVEIQLSLAGRPGEGVQVELRIDGRRPFSPWKRTLDEQGFLRAEVLGRSSAVFEFRSPARVLLGKSDSMDLHPGGYRRLDLNLETGRLTAQHRVEVAEDTFVRLSGSGPSGSFWAEPDWIQTEGGAWQGEVGAVKTGRYTAMLQLGPTVQRQEIEIRLGEETLVAFD